MSYQLIKCSREGCKNETHEDSPMDMCFDCRLYMHRLSQTIQRTLKRMPYKTMDEIRKYDYRVCFMKECKSKAFLRNKCRTHYISQVNREEKNNK